MAEDWKNWSRRQRIIQQIDEYLKQTNETKSALELENSLFLKANKEEEYLQYVTKIIKYLKEQAQNTNQNNSALNAMLGGQQGNAVRPTAMGRAVNNGGQIVHTNQGQLVHPGNAGAQLGHANTSGGQVTHTVVSGNQSVGASGMMQGAAMVPGPNRMPQLMQGNMANQGEMVNWQTHGKPRFQNCQNDMIMIVNSKHPGMGNINQMNPQATKMGTLPMSVPGQNEQVTQMNVGGQMARQGMTMQPRVPSPSFSVGGAAAHPRQGTPTPTGASPVSQQQQQHVPHSTLTFISPSPSSNAVPSPVNAGAGRQMNQLGAPSPGGMINTPGQPQQQQPSPVASTSLEDRAYLEKIKQLQSKYLEPLRDVVQRFDNSDSENSRKVRNLLELIENPQKRSAKALETLKACEAVLERLGIQQREHRSSDGTAVSKPAAKESPIMVLFESINFAMKSPLGPHTIHRTLSPALKTLLGPDIEPHIPKYLKVEEQPKISSDTPEISDLIQGEIARLPSRFKVNLETQLMSGSDDLILTCQLDDPNLPCVPPITLTLPPTYPNAPPRCRLSEVEYETTSFLRTVREIMKTREYHLPEVCSLTMILESWEMSVRRACCPKPFIPDSVDPLSNVNILF
ncbi:UNVERIFIED_CONTAM: hypothetical protein RMT77_015130 [Armadillidium vulgare]